jgi:homoserine kinase type II
VDPNTYRTGRSPLRTAQPRPAGSAPRRAPPRVPWNIGAFTDLTAKDTEDLLAQLGLPPPRRVEILTAGTINTNARVETTDGRVWFLRINEGKTDEEVALEVRLCQHLAARGVPTPLPLAPPLRHVRSGKLVTIFPWLDGAHVGADAVTELHTRAVGQALARLHLAGRDFPERRRGIYTMEHIAARVQGLAGTADPQLASVLPDLRPELDWLARVRPPNLPDGVIHQDLFRDNVLFLADGRLALLDFEQAVWGRFAYDLAVCLCAWTFRAGVFDPGLANALVDAYDVVRPLSAVERAALVVEARAAALRFTVTRITDVYLCPGGAPGGKDFRSYLARLRVLQRSGLPIR